MDKRSHRAIVWNIIYYVLIIFCTFYLKEKLEIKNWNVIFVFLPLIFLAFSTESFSKIGNCKVFTPYNYIDFSSKVVAFIFSQLIFRHIVQGVLFWLCLSGIIFCVIISIVCSIFMIVHNKKQENVNY